MAIYNKLIRNLSIVSFVLFSNAVFAHFPLMQCWYKGNNIECETSYSDGSKAIDYQVRMFDYEDNLIAKENTDRRSIATFKRSVDEFYFIFDSGHENPVEVDSVEISEK